MQTKKNLLVVLLAGLLLTGLGLSRSASPVTADTVAQTEVQSAEEETADDLAGEAQTIVAAEAQSVSVMTVLETSAELESFRVLVEAAVLANNLDHDGPFTVFVPTNSAMATINNLLNRTAATPTEVLLYHVVNGRYTTTDLVNRGSLPTLLGERLTFTAEDGEIILNGETAITTMDITAGNGIIHVVNGVLLPPAGSPFISDSRASTLDEVLAADGRFTTFLSLLERAGLKAELANRVHTYTVLAPTDAAFAQWPEELHDRLLNEPDYLEMILTYHLVSDFLDIGQIANGEYIPTVEGRPLVISRDEEEQLLISGESVESANILAANGIIHVVEAVLTP
jgi:transforming growth factor-beta-induced protein